MGRWAEKNTTGSYCNLSMNYLTKQGYIRQGVHRWGSLQWSWGGEPTSNIGFTVNTLDAAPYFQPHYTNTSTGEKFDYKIPLLATTPHYGGVRWWFCCPCCGKRVGVLYLGARYFACRHCYNLAYDSQREIAPQRYMRQMDKIAHGMETDDDGYYIKPKGMHWRTFNRKMDAIGHYDKLWAYSIGRRFGIV